MSTNQKLISSWSCTLHIRWFSFSFHLKSRSASNSELLHSICVRMSTISWPSKRTSWQLMHMFGSLLCVVPHFSSIGAYFILVERITRIKEYRIYTNVKRGITKEKKMKRNKVRSCTFINGEMKSRNSSFMQLYIQPCMLVLSADKYVPCNFISFFIIIILRENVSSICRYY